MFNWWRRSLTTAAAATLVSCGPEPTAVLRPPPLVISARVPAAEPAPAPVPATVIPIDGLSAVATPSSQLEGFPKHGAAFHVMSQVHAAPAADAPVIAYMRRGARFRARGPERGSGCAGGWYALPDRGYVCRGQGFTIGDAPQRFEPAPAPPTRQGALPYRYGRTVGRDAMQFWRIPEGDDLAVAAAGLEKYRAHQEVLRKTIETAGNAAGADVQGAQTPTGGEDGDAEAPRLLPEFVRMVMEPGFYVSLDGDAALDDPDADYVRTVRGAQVERSTLAPAELPTLRGRTLPDADALPLGFVYRTRARRFRMDGRSGRLQRDGEWARYSALPLSPHERVVDGDRFAVTRAGEALVAHALRVARLRARPAQVPRNARWVHVSLQEQVLVAYEGSRPVYATLVSTGKEGFETPAGLFRIHAKHVSTTMDGAEGTDEVYSIEDVPWTMYFHGSIALHGAFWHDRFGRTRSHGCVNLAPDDAQWLFQWATPAVPPGQHGVMPRLSDPTTYVLVE